MRAALRQIADDGMTVVVGCQTAGSDFVRHGSARLNLPCEILSNATAPPTSRSGPPACDRQVFQKADTIYVLTLRSGGNIHALLREFLSQRRLSVILIDLPELQQEAVKTELCQLGAQLWQPPADSRMVFPAEESISVEPSTSVLPHVYPLSPFPNSIDGCFLTHSTRSCPGPWPGESFEQYADSLLCGTMDADHSALGTLRRIVVGRRLIASGQAIRGGFAVVSLSACTPQQLLPLHRFQSHRMRWDFEPYGLCISRSWLEQRGARPVTYGDEATWAEMAESDRPFFQLAQGASRADWTAESEWRHLNDIDLRELTAKEAFVVVPNFEAAKLIVPVSPWPVTLWPENSASV